MRGFVFLCLLGCGMAEIGSWNYTWDGPEGPIDDSKNNVCVTDVSSCGCCAMKKEVKRMEKICNVSLTMLRKELEHAQSIINNTIAARSAFSAALTDTRRCVGNSREEIVVIYQVLFLNLVDNYNSVTGVYTAPRNGVYSIAVTVYSDAGSPGALLAACVVLRVNGRELASLSERNDQDQEDSSSLVLAVQLRAGDRVYVTLPPGCLLCDSKSHFNTFSGFLLYATD